MNGAYLNKYVVMARPKYCLLDNMRSTLGVSRFLARPSFQLPTIVGSTIAALPLAMTWLYSFEA